MVTGTASAVQSRRAWAGSSWSHRCIRPVVTTFLCVLLAVVPVISAFTADTDADANAPRIETFSIRNEPVGQVLLAFAEQTGISVVMDATVTGSVSVVLHDVAPWEVLNEVARAADLFVREQNGVYWLSKVRVRRTSRGGWQLDSHAARLQSVVAAVVRESGRSIVVRDGADRPVTTAARTHSVRDLLVAVAAEQNLTVTERSDVLVVHKPVSEQAPENNALASPPGIVEITVAADGGIALQAHEATTEKILTTVADRAGMVLLATGPPAQRTETLELSAENWTELYRRIGVALDVTIERDADLLLVEPRHRGNAFEPFRRYAVFPTGTVPASDAADLLTTIPELTVEWVDTRSYRVVVSGLPGKSNGVGRSSQRYHMPNAASRYSRTGRQVQPLRSFQPRWQPVFPKSRFTPMRRRIRFCNASNGDV